MSTIQKPRLTIAKAPEDLKVRRPESVSDILSEPLPGYIIRPLVAEKSVYVLYGDANCGKTFLALDLAARIATGGTWREQHIKAGVVLYVVAEGASGMSKRLRALMQRYPGLPAAPLRILRQPVDLISAVDDILVRARDINEDLGRLSLIVLDTLAQTLGGRDENSGDMAAYIAAATRLATETGAAVIILHHSGKDSARGARGHSALRGNVDGIYKITTSDDGRRTVQAEKARDDDVPPFGFTLRTVAVGRDADGIEQSSCIVDYCDGSAAAAGKRPITGSSQKLLYRIASEIAAGSAEQGKLAPNGRPIIERERLVETWQATQKAAGRRRASPSYIIRPLSDLVDAGYLVHVGDDSWTLA